MSIGERTALTSRCLSLQQLRKKDEHTALSGSQVISFICVLFILGWTAVVCWTTRNCDTSIFPFFSFHFFLNIRDRSYSTYTNNSFQVLSMPSVFLILSKLFIMFNFIAFESFAEIFRDQPQTELRVFYSIHTCLSTMVMSAL